MKIVLVDWRRYDILCGKKKCVRDFSIASIHCIRFFSFFVLAIFLSSSLVSWTVQFFIRLGVPLLPFCSVCLYCSYLILFDISPQLPLLSSLGFFFYLKMDPDMSELFRFCTPWTIFQIEFYFLGEFKFKIRSGTNSCLFFLSHKRSGWHFILGDFFFFFFNPYKNLYISRGDSRTLTLAFTKLIISEINIFLISNKLFVVSIVKCDKLYLFY